MIHACQRCFLTPCSWIMISHTPIKGHSYHVITSFQNQPTWIPPVDSPIPIRINIARGWASSSRIVAPTRMCSAASAKLRLSTSTDADGRRFCTDNCSIFSLTNSQTQHVFFQRFFFPFVFLCVCGVRWKLKYFVVGPVVADSIETIFCLYKMCVLPCREMILPTFGNRLATPSNSFELFS